MYRKGARNLKKYSQQSPSAINKTTGPPLKSNTWGKKSLLKHTMLCMPLETGTKSNNVLIKICLTYFDYLGTIQTTKQDNRSPLSLPQIKSNCPKGQH